jgi:hypothetical protein
VLDAAVIRDDDDDDDDDVDDDVVGGDDNAAAAEPRYVLSTHNDDNDGWQPACGVALSLLRGRRCCKCFVL